MNRIKLRVPTELQYDRNAFTLIELSIVLIVIGLLIGGVLVGRDLISAAKVRAFSSQMNQIQQAITTFKLKYNCVPGDCNKATQLGLGSNGGGNGMVDNQLDVMSGCAVGDDPLCDKVLGSRGGTYMMMGRIRGEGNYLWVHLGAAGLLANTYQQVSMVNGSADADPNNIGLYFPKSAFDKGYLVAFSWGGKLFVRTGLSAISSVGGGTFNTASLTASQMQQLDMSQGYKDLYVGSPYGSPEEFSSWLWTGRKVTPIGTYDMAPAYYGYNCAVQTGATTYKYNINQESAYGVTPSTPGCNVMWQMDY